MAFSCRLQRVVFSKAFERDLRKLSARQIISPEFIQVFYCLFAGEILPARFKDHPLQGELKGYRDCHVFNDLVLIYKVEQEVLSLLRLNSHAEIFG